MSRHFTNKITLDDKVEQIIRTSDFLGKGNNGVVYRITPHKIIKIFNEVEVCRREYEVLIESSKCKSFPQVYDFGDYYIVREYVDGIRLDKYLNHNPLNEALVESIVGLIAAFKSFNYTKLDIRCKDLYVQEDYSLKVIDPKDNFHKEMDYPRHLMRGIYKRDSIGEFFYFLNRIDRNLYREWHDKFKSYLISLEEEL